MIELERHIEILLLNNDCVIIPGFGGFTAHHVEARYDEAEQLFLPPLRTLGFNPQLTMNDSLLALSYVEAYDISYPEALRRIDDDVRELRQRLEEEGSYELNYIGTIRVNDEGHYEFAPSEAGILTPKLYGLSSFEFLRIATSSSIALQKTVSDEATNDKPEPESTLVASSLTVSEKPTVDPAETEEPSDAAATILTSSLEKTVSIRVSVLRDFAIAACVVLAFLLFPTRLSINDPHTTQSGKLDTSLLYRVMPKDITTGQVPTQLIKPQTQTSQAEPTAKETTKPTAEPIDTLFGKPYFSIVLASRVTLKNAQTYVDQLHRNGYEEASVLRRKKGAKVIFGRFKTQNEAYTSLRSLRRHSEFAEAWVMLIK